MKTKLTITIWILIGIMCVVFFGGFLLGFYPVRYDGPYKGQIIDAETGTPMEGVVILGIWSTEVPTAGGGVSSYYDAKETLTDKNGEFKIKGLGLKILSNVTPMNVVIFKFGYEHIGLRTWESLKTSAAIEKKKIKWEGNKVIIPIKKLTMEERKKSATFPPYPPTKAPKENIKLIMEEIYKERKERGLD